MTSPDLQIDRSGDPLGIGAIRPALFVPGFWLAVGIGGGLSQFLASRVAGTGAGLIDMVSGPVIAALLWIPITWCAAQLARRWPLRSPPLLLVHLVFAAASSLVLNLAFQTVSWIAPGTAASWDRVLPDALRFLPFNMGAWLAVVLITPWWLRGPREPPPATPRTIDAKVGGRLTRIPTENVAWIEARGDYAKVHATDGEYLISERMADLSRDLRACGFIRIHRSAIVNVGRVRALQHLSHGDYEARLDDGTALRVARSRRAELMRAIDATRSSS